MTGGPDLRSIRMLDEKKVRRSHKQLDEPILVSRKSTIYFLLLILCSQRNFNYQYLFHYNLVQKLFLI